LTLAGCFTGAGDPNHAACGTFFYYKPGRNTLPLAAGRFILPIFYLQGFEPGLEDLNDKQLLSQDYFALM
jgi:hypothetical protein